MNQRIRAFDWLRGLAVLVMIQTHSLGLLQPGLHAGGFFTTLQWIDGLVAPSFIFAAGFALALTQVRAAMKDDAGTPFLGICIGMQMLYEGSEEDPAAGGMGVLDGKVRRLPDGVKRPQMQWNLLTVCGETPMFDGFDDPMWMYFVHSYAPATADHVVATCDYGGPIVAAVQRDNLWATQFHPEKSGAAGLRLLANFVANAAN